MNDKNAYIAFCEQTPQLPLFMQPWWLNAVTHPDGKEWEAIVARNKQGDIEAVMAFVTGKKFGMAYAVTPQLTQYSGVWIKDKENESVSERLSREKRLQNTIIEQLEARRFRFFDIKFPLNYTYWSPFYWAGYQQETHYSFRIDNLGQTQEIFDRFDYAKQKQIRKAQEAGIEVDYDMTADELYDLQCTQLTEIGSRDVLSRALVRSVVETSRNRGQGLIARAKDQQGNTQAAIFVVWNENSAWELISAIHPDFRASGASTLVVWEAMKKLADKTKAWDFEGSMIENVDNSFRQFGATPFPYFEITKRTKLLKIIDLCRK